MERDALSEANQRNERTKGTKELRKRCEGEIVEEVELVAGLEPVERLELEAGSLPATDFEPVECAGEVKEAVVPVGSSGIETGIMMGRTVGAVTVDEWVGVGEPEGEAVGLLAR